MRITDSTKDTAVFIGYEKTDGNVHWGGTGFFVEIPLTNDPSVCHRYFVTASHVADKLEGKKSFVRINKKGGGVETFELDENQQWFRHPTSPTDVALFLCAPNPNKFDYRSITVNMFLTSDSATARQIGIGDEVVIVGLFTYHTGETRNIPLVRFGNLSMFPDERIANVKIGESNGLPEVAQVNAYLIEVRSTGGLSGSPVFVKESVFMKCREPNRDGLTTLQGEGDPHFLGLLQGHWEIDPSNRNSATLISPDTAAINLGIAIVIPAYVIREILEQEELVAERKAREEKYAGNRWFPRPGIYRPGDQPSA